MMSIFVILGLLVCVKAEGASSGTPVFVQRGEDLLLCVKERVEMKKGSDFKWKVNGRTNIVKFFGNNDPIIYDDYEGRVELYVQNYTLCLKNVQKADSGRYTAVVSGTFDRVVAEYKVTVLDPVSPVNLTVDSVSSSSDSCNLTVTCSTQDSHISSTFTCDAKTCSQEGGERSEVTTSGASLRVYLVNDSITCNHSNQVSWTKDVTKIQDFCPCHAGSECVSAGISVCLLKTIVFSVGLIIMVSAVISVNVVEKLKKQK
ncbi:uncharacterized protein LOC119010947 [Acanthopagrus latus]|uniref:uncharacterized protein LOC119010947 n=1 Tax=Acanthopagrus latus TaxID=8177 RepID=UPI00187C730F|nr:uncharacterized protein LOC119010947 [Acanthopagrus latus]XP_036939479.1 uncharacterized protein LOC119010947 [Acanthopagrus latus]